METSIEEGQSPSASSAHNSSSGPNVYAVPRPTVSRVKHRIKQSRNWYFLGEPQAPAAAAAITSLVLAEPPAAAVGEAQEAAVPAPASAEAPSAVQQQRLLTPAQ